MSVEYEELKSLLLSETGCRSVRELARKVDMEASTLNRQLKSRMPIETLVAICRRFNVAITPMMVEVGYITPAEAHDGSGIGSALEAATDEQLTSEILRRVKRGNAGGAITEPMAQDLPPD